MPTGYQSTVAYRKEIHQRRRTKQVAQHHISSRYPFFFCIWNHPSLEMAQIRRLPALRLLREGVVTTPAHPRERSSRRLRLPVVFPILSVFPYGMGASPMIASAGAFEGIKKYVVWWKISQLTPGSRYRGETLSSNSETPNLILT